MVSSAIIKIMLSSCAFITFFSGGEEGRGWSSNDPSRRRISGPAVNAGSLSKQKNPIANEASVSKDAMVSPL